MKRYNQIKAIDVILSKKDLSDAVRNVYRRKDNDSDLQKQEFIKLTAKVKEEAMIGRSDATRKLIESNYCTIVPKFDFINSGVFSLIIFNLPREDKNNIESIDCEMARDSVNLTWYIEL